VKRDGLSALSEEERASMVLYPEAFLESVRSDAFKRYTDNVILRDYSGPGSSSSSSSSSSSGGGGGGARVKGDERVTSTSSSSSPENFFASRIVTDEAIAAALAKSVVSSSPSPSSSSSNESINNDKKGEDAAAASPLIVCVCEASRVKFGMGIQERARLVLKKLRGDPSPSKVITTTGAGGATVFADSDVADVVSVLLNPDQVDSASPTVQLRLTLAYGKYLVDQRPLANYLWYSDSPRSSLLTRAKNPVNNEGEKPSGESSIIGAF